MKISETTLSTRIKIACKNCRIDTIEQLGNLTFEQFSQFRNIGKISIYETEEYLKLYGLTFREE